MQIRDIYAIMFIFKVLTTFVHLVYNNKSTLGRMDIYYDIEFANQLGLSPTTYLFILSQI